MGIGQCWILLHRDAQSVSSFGPSWKKLKCEGLVYRGAQNVRIATTPSCEIYCFPEVKDILKGLFWMDLQNRDPQKIWVPRALGLLIWTWVPDVFHDKMLPKLD